MMVGANKEGRHGLVIHLKGKSPKVASTAFLAPRCTVIGNVTIMDDVSVWYGAVLRGDVAPIKIGKGTNIQDGAVVHVSSDRADGTVIGANVTVGHLALVHACTIGDECMVGMKSCIMDGVVLEKNSWVAAGAIVTPGKLVRSGELWAGIPAKPIRTLSANEIETILKSARGYVANAREHADAARSGE